MPKDTIVFFADNTKIAAELAKSFGDYYTYKVGGNSVFEIKTKKKVYKFAGVKGHILEYKYTKELADWNIDVSNVIWQKPSKVNKKGTIVPMVRAIVPDADQIVVATSNSPDGETIGYEIMNIVNRHFSNKTVVRMRYNHLDKSHIQHCYRTLSNLNSRFASLKDVKDILEYQYNAALTRLLTTIMKEKNPHIGTFPVDSYQIPICGYVYQRDNEIYNFVEQDYWIVKADLIDKKGKPFNMYSIEERIYDKSTADKISKTGRKDEKAIVQNIENDDKRIVSPGPLTYTTLMSECSKHFGMNPETINDIAFNLYENGYISNPMTESVCYPNSYNFTNLLMELSESSSPYKKYTDNILQENNWELYSKNDKDDVHLSIPIHPVALLTQDDVRFIRRKALKDDDQIKVYDLICRHFLATFMNDMVYNDITIHASLGTEAFYYYTHNVIDYGWTRVYPWYRINDGKFVNCDVGDELEIKSVNMVKNKTKQPKPMTSDELVLFLNEKNVGLNAELHRYISEAKNNDFLRLDGTRLHVTDMGYDFVSCLEKEIPSLLTFNTQTFFEKLAYEVGDGRKSKNDALLQGQRLIKMIVDAIKMNKDGIRKRIDETFSQQKNKLIHKCPECSGFLVLRKFYDKKGDQIRVAGCSNYPNCKVHYKLPLKGDITHTDNGICKKTGLGVVIINDIKSYPWGLGVGPCFSCNLRNECDFMIEYNKKIGYYNKDNPDKS